MSVNYTPEILVKNTALEIGFSAVGITGIEESAESRRAFDRWIEEGRHGEMRYLSGGADKRHDPALLLDGAKSVICVAVNYYTSRGSDANRLRRRSANGVFSIYAHGRDYHVVLSEMLHELDRRLRDFFPLFESAVCVDTQPISERDLAIKSGVGWLGKNTCVINPEFGSWVFLGELITNLDLESDPPLETLCGSCTICVDACPTGALDEEFVLDATKCISYLTIEKRADIPEKFHRDIGDNIFGCDVCQQVCPYNAVASDSHLFVQNRAKTPVEMDLRELTEISDDGFLQLTRESAIRRCKADGLRRNAGIVLRNLQRMDSEA